MAQAFSGAAATHNLSASADDSRSRLDALPGDVWSCIGSQLSVKDLLHLQLTCHDLHEALPAADSMWSRQCAKIWGPACHLRCNSWYRQLTAGYKAACQARTSQPQVFQEQLPAASHSQLSSSTCKLLLHGSDTEAGRIHTVVAAGSWLCDFQWNSCSSPECTTTVRNQGRGAGVLDVLNISTPTGRLGLITGNADHTVKLWGPTDTQKPVRVLQGHTEGVSCLQLVSAPQQGSILASGSGDRTVRLWALTPLLPAPSSSYTSGSRQQLAVLQGHTRKVTCLTQLADMCGQSDSQLLASADVDGHVLLWDILTAQGTGRCNPCVKYRLRQGVQKLIPLPALSPHAFAAVQAAAVQVLDRRQAEPVWTIEHPGPQYFSPPKGPLGRPIASVAAHNTMLALASASSVLMYDLRGIYASSLLMNESTSGSRGMSSSSCRSMCSGSSGIQSCSSSSSMRNGSSSGSSSIRISSSTRPVLRLQAPTRQASPLCHLHLDTYKLVAATDWSCGSPATAHASIFAWDVGGSGESVAELSSRPHHYKIYNTVGHFEAGSHHAEDLRGNDSMINQNSDDSQDAEVAELLAGLMLDEGSSQIPGEAPVVGLCCKGPMMAWVNGLGECGVYDFLRGRCMPHDVLWGAELQTAGSKFWGE